jgi:regulator of replication initiation timing
MAVQHDPSRMFTSIHNLVKERDELRAEVNKMKAENNKLKAERNVMEIENKSLAENFESARLDFRVARDKLNTMEHICAIQSAKQVVLWKFIERLQNGQKGPPIDENGYWKDWNSAPMAPVSEASEPASERSLSTVGSKDSIETKLDPHAVGSIGSASDFTNVCTASFRPPKSRQVRRAKGVEIR